MAFSNIPTQAVANSATRTARTAIADKQIQDVMNPPDTNPAQTAAFTEYQNLRNRNPSYKRGQGTNRGQLVHRGGDFAGLTPDQAMSKIYTRDNPTPGSGPGGGLRTGPIQGAGTGGIDWLKANRTTGPELAAQERAVAPRMTPMAGQPPPAFKPAPQSNFEAAKAAGPVTPEKIAQAQAYGARLGQSFDPEKGYSPMAKPAPVAAAPSLTTGGLKTGNLNPPSPSAPIDPSGVFNRLAANQAAQPRATAPVSIQSGAFQNQSAMSAKPSATALTKEESDAQAFFAGFPSVPTTAPKGVSGPNGASGQPAPQAKPASKYEQTASAVTPSAYQKPVIPKSAPAEDLPAFNKRQAEWEAKRSQELAFLRDKRYEGRVGQAGKTAAVSAWDKDNPRPVFAAKGGRGAVTR